MRSWLSVTFYISKEWKGKLSNYLVHHKILCLGEPISQYWEGIFVVCHLPTHPFCCPCQIILLFDLDQSISWNVRHFSHYHIYNIFQTSLHPSEKQSFESFRILPIDLIATVGACDLYLSRLYISNPSYTTVLVHTLDTPDHTYPSLISTLCLQVYNVEL